MTSTKEVADQDVTKKKVDEKVEDNKEAVDSANDATTDIEGHDQEKPRRRDRSPIVKQRSVGFYLLF
jgi:hypothetical protein